jgi:hypothetical protein
MSSTNVSISGHAAVDRAEHGPTVYPAPTIEESTEITAMAILRCHAALFPLRLASSERSELVENVAQAEHQLASLTPASRATLEQMCGPATRQEISMYLATVMASFPDRSKLDDHVYGKVLPEEVGALQPSLGAVDAGCRRLRREFQTRYGRRSPSVPEVVAAIREAEGIFRSAQQALKELPARVAEAKRRIAKGSRSDRA